MVALLLAACFADPPTVDLDSDPSSDDGGTTGTTPGATSTSGSGGSDDADDAVATSDSTGFADSTGSTSSGSTDGDEVGSTSAEDTSTGDDMAPRLVFVTQDAFFANLSGVAGADARCAAAAADAQLSGEFLAWISDEAVSPDDRFVHAGGPWVRVDGAVVAQDWDDLIDGVLENPIELDAQGQSIDDQLGVWTNTNWDGTALGADCQGWTSMAFADSGIFGDFAQSNDFGQWTAWGNPSPFPCENTFHLYCFEQ